MSAKITPTLVNFEDGVAGIDAAEARQVGHF
jgi:hypothetical protein